MTTASLAELTETQTPDSVMGDLLNIATAVNLQTTSWQPGAVVRTVFRIVAQKMADFTSISIQPINGGFGDLVSSDAWADQWALGTFNTARNPAKPATGYYQLTNALGTTYSLNPGDLIVATTTGRTFRNTLPVTVAASGVTASIPIASDLLGVNAGATPGEVSIVVAPSMPGVTGTNPLALLGADAELTPQLITRARSSLAVLSPNGPKNAYNFVATSSALPDGTPLTNTTIPITRSLTVADAATGNVTLYVANATGAPSGGDVAIVQAAIDTWAEPWCVTATVVAANNLNVSVTYVVWVKGSSLNAAAIKEKIQTALTVYLATVPIGGNVIPPATGQVYKDQIQGVIETAVAGIVHAVVSFPTGDVAVAVNEVPVLLPPSGTVNFL